MDLKYHPPPTLYLGLFKKEDFKKFVKWFFSVNISVSSEFLRVRLSEHTLQNHLCGADSKVSPWGGCGVLHFNELQDDSHSQSSLRTTAQVKLLPGTT